MTDNERKYHVEEYKSPRTEMLAFVKFQFNSFIYALVADGDIVTWPLTHGTARPWPMGGKVRVAASGLGWDTFLASKEERVLSARFPRGMALGWAFLAISDLWLPVLAWRVHPRLVR